MAEHPVFCESSSRYVGLRQNLWPERCTPTHRPTLEDDMLPALGRILKWSGVTGGIAFALGFFGPIILTPDANQGPLLGIFITGPLGLLIGAGFGIMREILGRKATPGEIIAGLGISRDSALRIVAGAGGVLLLVRGIAGITAGAGRPAASAIVIGLVLGWYAAVGVIPAWFRR